MLTPAFGGLPTGVAEGLGGALLNDGALDVKDTVFTENSARDGGLAIQNLQSATVFSSVTFDGNILSCPSQTYSYAQDVSMHSLPCVKHIAHEIYRFLGFIYIYVSNLCSGSKIQ